MWSYYGAKTNIVDFYPKPIHHSIIEPFAGTARYSLKYFEKDITLIDKFPEIIKIWKWLQICSPKDILSMPRVKAVENINSFKYDCEEQRLLMGYTIGFGFYKSRHIATPRLRHRPNHQIHRLKQIADNLFKIRHWRIIEGSYEDADNTMATWFIDPPYEFGGSVYIMSSKKIDFKKLALWCIERNGQAIVCENDKATWMPFMPLCSQSVRTGKTNEVIWTNEQYNYSTQQELFR